MKRLYETRDDLPSIDQLLDRNPEGWNTELRWWSGVGINTDLLLVLLEGARVKRQLYERRLKDRADSLTDWEIRRARSALKRAEPLIRLLKTEWIRDDRPPELVFGDLGEQVEHSVQGYIRALDARRPSLPAHRPDDPWLRSGVLTLI